MWRRTIDKNTSKKNNDVWLKYKDVPAIEYCRSIIVNDVPCDLPNIQTLMRIYCDADSIDSLDPTVNDNKNFALGSINPNGYWRIGGCEYAWSSTSGGLYYYCRYVHCTGSCSSFAISKSAIGSIIPIQEIKIKSIKR